MSTVGKPWPSRDEGLSTWLDQAEKLLNQYDREALKRDDLDAQIAEAQRVAVTKKRHLDRADEQLAAWHSAWKTKLERLEYEPDMTVAQVDAILAEIQALSETMIKYRGQRSQVQSIDRDVESFTSDAGRLAERVAPDLAARSYVDQVREMNRRLKDARAREERRGELVRQRAIENGSLRNAENQHGSAADTLDQLCRDAGCDSPDDLALANERSRELIRLENDLQASEIGLHALAAGEMLDSFAATVEQTRFDDLAPRIGETEAEILTHDADLQAVTEALGRTQAELRLMDGGDHSAEASEASQAVLARLRGDVARYATLRLAASVLQRGIDRYREKNQGPTLARASELFKILTGGSFAGLRIDDDEGKAVLQGVRGDGSIVGTSGMSDGSHDQLYLALRLASLESWLRTHEPIPLIVDDLLLNFDDRRSLAALRALEELSRRTQVLFFTHHRHLCDIAKAHLDGETLFRHELADPCLAR